MTDIERYSPEISGVYLGMEASEVGEYVRFDDHLYLLKVAREQGRREALDAATHLCLELSETVDPKKNLALRKGMHDAGAIIDSMSTYELEKRATTRSTEKASWNKA